MQINARDFLPLLIQTQADQSARYIYIRQHVAEGSPEPESCSIFVTGLPASQNELQTALQAGFTGFGTVQSVVLHPSKASAVVCMTENRAWEKLQKAAARGLVVEMVIPPGEHATGLRSWVEEHKRPFVGNATLRQQLDDWMVQHEAEEAAKKQADNAQDGWTVVRRRGGRRKTTDAAGTAVGAVAPAAAEAKLKSRKQPKVLENFYKFQQRNKRRSEIMDLQEQFERDKRKISELKAARRFKPY